ncbi:MAG: transposase [Actinobacteria bacterium]|jgi:putative transposase|nr:transposase [Actinomycetota bacterium]
MRNLLAVARTQQRSVISALIRTIFAQPDRDAAVAQLRSVVDQLERLAPTVAERLQAMEDDLLAYTAYPPMHSSKIWSNNPISVNRPKGPTAGAGCVAGGRLGWTLERAGEGRADDGAGSGRYRGHLAA